MNEETKTTISVLKTRIRTKEEELNGLKRMVNDLCQEEGDEQPYPNIAAADSAGDLSSIRPDRFYGLTIAIAAKAYLEMRKSSNLSASSVNEIYEALKKGGYAFETDDENNRKNGLRISLRKNPSIFHQLPNGDYGLMAWYPKVKARDDEAGGSARKRGRTKRIKPTARPALPAASAVKTPSE